MAKYYKVWNKKHGGSLREGSTIYPVPIKVYESLKTEEEIETYIKNYEAEKTKKAIN